MTSVVGSPAQNESEVMSRQRLDLITDALSVDVEDYFHVEAFANQIRSENWPTFAPRVHANCERILALFAKYDWRATFIELGWEAFVRLPKPATN
jgi:hypothetical protein